MGDRYKTIRNLKISNKMSQIMESSKHSEHKKSLVVVVLIL